MIKSKGSGQTKGFWIDSSIGQGLPNAAGFSLITDAIVHLKKLLLPANSDEGQEIVPFKYPRIPKRPKAPTGEIVAEKKRRVISDSSDDDLPLTQRKGRGDDGSNDPKAPSNDPKAASNDLKVASNDPGCDSSKSGQPDETLPSVAKGFVPNPSGDLMWALVPLLRLVDTSKSMDLEAPSEDLLPLVMLCVSGKFACHFLDYDHATEKPAYYLIDKPVKREQFYPLTLSTIPRFQAGETNFILRRRDGHYQLFAVRDAFLFDPYNLCMVWGNGVFVS